MGSDLPESICDLQRCLEVGLFPVGEAKEKPYPVHVRIQRDDKLGWRDQVPAPGVYLILPHHPSQKKVEPLAGTAFAWCWDEEWGSRGEERLRKTLESRNDRIIFRAKMGHKALLEGAILFYHRSRAPKQSSEIISQGESMFEVMKGVKEALMS